MKTLKRRLILWLAGLGVLLVGTPGFAGIIFVDDFESQPANLVNNTSYSDTSNTERAFPATTGTGGTWHEFSAGYANQVQVTKFATPGAASGTNYLRQVRPDWADPSYIVTTAVFTPQTTVGDQIRVEADFYLPVLGAWIYMAGKNGTTAAFDWTVASWTEGGTPTISGVNTTVAPTAATWQHWQMDYVIGSANVVFKIGGTEKALVLGSAVGGLDRLEFQFGAATLDVDNLTVSNLGPIPEPSAVMLLLAGVSGLFVRARRQSK